MTLRNFLMVVVAVSVIFGLGLLFIPGPFMGFFGLRLDPAGIYMGRVLSAALIALAIIYWQLAETPMSALVQRALVAGLVFSVIGFIFAVVATTSGVASAAGWIIVLLHLALGAGFAWFAFGKR